MTFVLFPARITINGPGDARCPGAQLHISGKVAGSLGDAREPLALFADAECTIPLPNPVIADTDGLLPLIYLSSSRFDCLAATAAGKILCSFFDCVALPSSSPPADPGTFGPASGSWGPDVQWRSFYPDTASSDLLKRLGISTDTPPDAGDPSHREL
jgi:hypothetical protein